METRFKERISNVISWAGFLWLVGWVVTAFYFILTNKVDLSHILFVGGGTGIAGWMVLGVVNYLLCDDLRLLPWEEKEGS
tara:strand:+ start:197 stop:436 length:240 start_codon:yes stop_codon:yes gene_type:complete